MPEAKTRCKLVEQILMLIEMMQIMPFGHRNRRVTQQFLDVANISAFGKHGYCERVPEPVGMQVFHAGDLAESSDHVAEGLTKTFESAVARPEKKLRIGSGQRQQQFHGLFRQFDFNRSPSLGFERFHGQVSGCRVQRAPSQRSHVTDAQTGVQEQRDQSVSPLPPINIAWIHTLTADTKTVAGFNDAGYFVLVKRRRAEFLRCRLWNSRGRVVRDPAAGLRCAPGEERSDDRKLSSPTARGQMFPLDASKVADVILIDGAHRNAAGGFDKWPRQFFITVDGVGGQTDVRIFKMGMPKSHGSCDGQANFDTTVDAPEKILHLAVRHCNLAGLKAVADGFVGTIDAASYPDRALAKAALVTTGAQAFPRVATVGYQVCGRLHYLHNIMIGTQSEYTACENIQNTNVLWGESIRPINPRLLKTLILKDRQVAQVSSKGPNTPSVYTRVRMFYAKCLLQRIRSKGGGMAARTDGRWLDSGGGCR